jgi:pyrroloquinoline quinone (PQQ) biosynthesis protein C
VEHFKSPFGPADFVGSRAVENQIFFDTLLDRARGHRFFSHPFMLGLDAHPTREVVSFILTSFYKIVSPFTGLLCSLGGRAPDLRSRFALMDNIFEEMGCGDLEAAHPSLYLKMLSSIGVTSSAAEAERTLPAIRRINDHLEEVVHRRSFAVACAVLASAEATIPPSFPILAKLAQHCFPEADQSFFERHGPRDEGHSNDAAMLFAVTADSADFEVALAEINVDLDFRTDLLDDWMAALDQGHYIWSAVADRAAASERPARRGSTRPPRMPSVRPPASNRLSVPPPSV